MKQTKLSWCHLFRPILVNALSTSEISDTLYTVQTCKIIVSVSLGFENVIESTESDPGFESSGFGSIAPKMLWIQYLAGINHFAECRENRL